jgi:TfoX/Sxy family transcriptional regulator of competence genes
MAYDLALAQRVRELIKPSKEVTEREQFGGVAFLLGGNVACGVLGDELLVRVGPERHEEAMKSKGAKPFSLTGRPSKGWILVGQAGLKPPANLRKWVEMGLDFAKTLPAK